MSIKLIGDEALTDTVNVIQEEDIEIEVKLQHNYLEGFNLGTFIISSDFDGILDSQEIPIQEGEITLSYSGSNFLMQNISVLISGGDNEVILAEKLYEFDSGGQVLIKSKVRSGNIKIIFAEGEERSITSEPVEGYLVITFTYLENDSFIDFLALISGNQYIETNSLIEAITGSLIEHDINNGMYPAAIRIDDTHFLIAYTGYGNDGFLKTFIVTDYIPAEISGSVLEHDTTEGTYSQLEQIDGNHFLLLYARQYQGLCAKVIAINANYIPSVITTYAPSGTDFAGNFPSLAKIDSSHFYVAYSATPTARIAYLYINPSTYSITRLQIFTHEATNIGYYNSLKKLDDTHLILAYADEGSNYGTLKVFNVTPTISLVAGSELRHSIFARYNSLEVIDSNHCLLAYNDNYTGTVNICLKTFYIGIDYIPSEITGSYLNMEIGYYPVIKKVSSSCYLLMAMINSIGNIRVIGIDSNYCPVVVPDNSIVTGMTMSNFPAIEKLTESCYICSFAGTGSDGYVLSIYVDYLKGKALSDISTDNQLEGEFIPEILIKELLFQGIKKIGDMVSINKTFSIPLKSQVAVNHSVVGKVKQ